MEGFWQDLVSEPVAGPPYFDRYSVEIAAGRFLALPIRPLPAADQAVASLIGNQAGFTVIDALTEAMAALAARLRPEVVVGMPTLGLAFAPGIARALGHRNFVPLGYSRKFWYDEKYSTAIRSLTSPEAGKRLYIDPLIVPRLQNKRVVIIDDVVSTGASLRAVVELLQRLSAGIDIAGCVVAMRQGEFRPEQVPVESVFQTPRFIRRATGWWPA